MLRFQKTTQRLWGGMGHIEGGTTVRSLAVAVLALLSCGSLAPTRLDASCSVLEHGSHFDTDHLGRAFHPLILGDATTAADTAIPSDPKGSVPCSGPSCSRNPAPTSAPTLVQLWYVEHWILASAAILAPPLGAHLFWLDTARRRPSPLVSGPFRPPRGTVAITTL